MTNFALGAMGGVEYDFNCAGMCKTSTYFTFSNVTKGAPTQNCSVAVEHFAHEVGKTAKAWFWVFFTFIFLAAVYFCPLWSKDYNHLSSPLLGK